MHRVDALPPQTQEIPMNTRRLLPNLFVLSALCVGLMGADRAGCTDTAPCSFDSDCEGNQACVENTCRTLCQSDEDCAAENNASLICLAYTREGNSSAQTEAINVCIEPDSFDNNAANNTNNDPVGCIKDIDCSERFGEGAYCAATGTCIVPTEQTSVLIQPTGADPTIVLAVMLKDAQGNPLGYGVSQSSMSDAQASSPLLGRAPLLNSDGTCTTQGPRMPLSGADAYVHVRFVTEEGGPLVVDPSWKVHVITEHTNCIPDADGSNEYEVMQCVSTSEASFDRSTQCTQSLGVTTQGVAQFDLKPRLN